MHKYLAILLLLMPVAAVGQKVPEPEYRNGEWKCPTGYEFRSEGDLKRCTLSLTAPAPVVQKRTFDKKYVALLAGSVAASLLATKGIADCRREFGAANCAGGEGPSFAARESLRMGATVGMNLLAFKMKRGYERGNNPLNKIWWLPQVAISGWNTATFFRNDPDVAQWKGIVDKGKD